MEVLHTFPEEAEDTILEVGDTSVEDCNLGGLSNDRSPVRAFVVHQD